MRPSRCPWRAIPRFSDSITIRSNDSITFWFSSILFWASLLSCVSIAFHLGHSCQVLLKLNTMCFHFLPSFDPGFKRLHDILSWSASFLVQRRHRHGRMHHPHVCCSEAMDIVSSLLAETVEMPLMFEFEYVDGSGFSSVVKIRCFASLLRHVSI